MIEITETEETKEKAWLVRLDFKNSKQRGKESLAELEGLLETLGVKTVGKTTASPATPSPAFLAGKGRTEEIINDAQNAEANLIVFDNDLSPPQQRNWEKASNIKVIDRQEVIINIFADRAATKEAALQVELASCQYYLPRLAGAWKHLSRQKGGAYGTRGEGEKQIETDKRLLKKKITKLKEELEEVKKQRATRKKLRREKEIFSCAIAGYTNAGKSTLINALTGGTVSAQNRLFDTLDPTTRKLTLPCGKEITISDTVGFIRNLPHQLIEAFKSTLEETLDADLILLLLDASSIEAEKHYKASMEVLKEIGADKNYILPIFNKTDLCEAANIDTVAITNIKNDTDLPITNATNINLLFLQSAAEEPIYISAATEAGIENLLAKIEEIASKSDRPVNLLIPHNRYDLLQLVKKSGRIISEEYVEEGIEVTAIVPEKTAAYLVNYIL